MKSTPNSTAKDTLKQLELQLDAAMHTLKLLQLQLDTAKAIIAGNELTTAEPILPAEHNRGTSKRDYSVWMLDGLPYSKGKIPLAVFQKYVDGKYTLTQLNQDLSPDAVFPKSVRGNKHLFKLAAEVAEEENDRFHPDIVKTRDGQQIRVTNQVGMNNFREMMRYLADYFKFPVDGHKLVYEKWKGLEAPFTPPNVKYIQMESVE